MTISPPHPRPARRRFFHLFRLLGFTAALSILLILFSLLVAGLPDAFTEKLSDRLIKSGIPLRFDSIRLSTHRGWVLENAVFYSASPDDLTPLFQARKLYVHLWPDDWKNLKNSAWDITLYAKNSQVSLGDVWENALPENDPFRTVQRMKIPLTASRSQITVHEAEINWGPLLLKASGNIRVGQPRQKEPTDSEWQRVAAETAAFISSLQTASAPHITASFTLHTERLRDSTLDLTLHADNLFYGDRTYGAVDGQLVLKNRLLTLKQLRMEESPGEAIQLTGRTRLNEKDVVLSVTNTLTAGSLLNLMPPGWKAALQRDPARAAGPLRFSATLGPAPLRNLFDRLRVDVEEARIERESLTVDPLTFRLTRIGTRLQITDLQAQANGGPVSGAFVYHLDSGGWEAEVDAQCPLATLDTLAGESLVLFLQRFEFPGEPPAVHLTLSKSAADRPLFLSGTLEGNNFTCGGVPVDQFQSSMRYTNEVLELTLLSASHGSRRFEGSVEVDFPKGLGRFDAASSFTPLEIQRVLAPGKTTLLDLLRFDGPVYAEAAGQIDYRNGTDHLVSGTFLGEQIGFGEMMSPRFTATVQAEGSRLSFTNASAELFGGTLRGSAAFDLFPGDGTAPYTLDVRSDALRLAPLLQAVSKETSDGASGELSGTLRFTADAAAGFWESVNGAGELHIRNGQLTNLPLFGGLSRLIRSSFAGFNLFSLNTFYADFRLRDGAIHSDDTQLGGTLFSARGRGRWSPETGLDFLVKAEPFRQTREDKEWFQMHLWAAEALKRGTSPFFQFLEFELTGPLNRPEWRFVNLPAAASSLLQRNLPVGKEK